MNLRWITGVAVAGALLFLPAGLASQATAELVVNGGFETGDFTGWTTMPAQQGSLFGVAAFEPHSGTYAAFFGAVTPPFRDTISQAIPTVSGATYTFSYWLMNDGGPANEFLVTWGGTTVQHLVDSGPFAYQQFTFTETATGPSTTIAFSSYQVPSFFRLDDVSVNPNQVIPEPGTLALMGLGVVSLAGYGWRRRQKVA